MSIQNFTDKDLQKIIGNVLRYGVIISLSVSTLGGIIVLSRHSSDIVSFANFEEKNENIFDLVLSLLQGIQHFNGESIIFLGVILLFLIPLVRLILSLFSFMLEKDRMYIVITLIVMLIIAISMSIGF